ncbi:hypothetical protein C1H46_036500 [Malus baccata]|uniref:Uncharacterized protein n=1 Tax=Malus baccata TaxID=106549 RepID=A0A540KUU1_MALBA|nr:hypothetical protein C1H46_036500 [Malus baccata]
MPEQKGSEAVSTVHLSKGSMDDYLHYLFKGPFWHHSECEKSMTHLQEDMQQLTRCSSGTESLGFGKKWKGDDTEEDLRVSGMGGHASNGEREIERERGRGRSGDLSTIAADPRFHECERGEVREKLGACS